MEKIFETQEGMKVVGTTINENGHLVVTYTPKMTARQFVESCFDGCRINRNKSTDSVVYEKDGKWFFELKKYDNGWVLGCSHYRVWSILIDQYGMKGNEIRLLIADVVKDTYNMGLVTPDHLLVILMPLVKDTYNMGLVTPYSFYKNVHQW